MCLFQIVETSLPLHELRPQDVLVRCVGEPCLFWTPKFRRAGGGARGVPPPPQPLCDEPLALDEGGWREGEFVEEGDNVDEDECAEGEADLCEPRDDFDALATLLEEVVESEGAQAQGVVPIPEPTSQSPTVPAPGPATEPLAPEALGPLPPVVPSPFGELSQQAVVAEGPSEPPLPLPLPPPPLPAEGARPRGKGFCTARLYDGQITFYPYKDGSGNGRFEAVCGNEAQHGPRCRLTRTSAPSARAGTRAAQGRPLGLMGAWLAISHIMPTKEEHESLVPFILPEHRVAGQPTCWTKRMGLLLRRLSDLAGLMSQRSHWTWHEASSDFFPLSSQLANHSAAGGCGCRGKCAFFCVVA